MFQKLMNQEYFQKDNDMKNTKIKNMSTKIFMMLPLISISMTANAFQTAPTPTLNSNTEIGQNGSNIDKNGKVTYSDKRPTRPNQAQALKLQPGPNPADVEAGRARTDDRTYVRSTVSSPRIEAHAAACASTVTKWSTETRSAVAT